MKCSTISCNNKARRRGLCDPCGKQDTTVPAGEQVEADRQSLLEQSQLTTLRARYKAALHTIDRQKQEIQGLHSLSEGLTSFSIQPTVSKGTSEATPVLVASDWHVEERVGGEVGGLNTFTPEIATARATEFFRAGLRLVKLLNQDVTINTVVLALLGDMITNDIHGAETAEKNDMLPMHAILHAQSLVVSGIDYILDNSEYDLVIPCHSGNHTRTTDKTRFGSENGHSLEYLMYRNLEMYYRDEPRITWIIPEGMHSYLDVYDTTIRFHHGHAVKYGGGVGGIYIPVNKAIAQWNKGRHADLDVFGHFHQLRDGGNFLCNGSLIGYNAFALSIKADYEPPKQALFLIDRKRGRTCTWPILFGHG